MLVLHNVQWIVTINTYCKETTRGCKFSSKQNWLTVIVVLYFYCRVVSEICMRADETEDDIIYRENRKSVLGECTF